MINKEVCIGWAAIFFGTYLCFSDLRRAIIVTLIAVAITLAFKGILHYLDNGKLR